MPSAIEKMVIKIMCGFVFDARHAVPDPWNAYGRGNWGPVQESKDLIEHMEWGSITARMCLLEEVRTGYLEFLFRVPWVDILGRSDMPEAHILHRMCYLDTQMKGNSDGLWEIIVQDLNTGYLELLLDNSRQLFGEKLPIFNPSPRSKKALRKSDFWRYTSQAK